jgi:hypothetical protein
MLIFFLVPNFSFLKVTFAFVSSRFKLKSNYFREFIFVRKLRDILTYTNFNDKVRIVKKSNDEKLALNSPSMFV